MTVSKIFPALLITISSICACADEPEDAVAAIPPEAELVALDDAWIEAEVSGDRAALERILHENFLITYPSGRTVDRSTFIEGILKSKPAPFTVTHESIQVYEDTAVIIDVSADLSEGGALKFTWVAVKRENQWRVISETASRIVSN